MDRLSNIVKQRLAAQQVATDAEHPSVDTLVAFAEQALRASERQRLLSHLAACPACRQTVSLAIPAEHVGPVALPHRRVLQFPMALRWVSATAALAVAIGVGVLSYEHQNRSSLTATAKVAPQTQEKSAAPSDQPAVGQSSEVAKTKEREAETEAKVVNRSNANSQSRNSQSRVLANADASARGFESPLKKAQRSSALGGLVAGSSPTTTLVRPNVADGFIASNKLVPPPPPPSAPADAKAITISDIAAAPRSPAAETSAAPVQLAATGRSNAQEEVAGTPRKAEKSTLSGPAEISLQEGSTALVARKTMASTALGGPIHGAVNGVAQIVHWTISATGKLERRLSDGRFTLIEPAPGTSIRTVAAQGIEVWAAGSQPDLSAKEWQQRPVLFHSSDAGETWTKVEGPWQSPISTLNLDSVNALTVITPNGSWTTLNAGKSWMKK